MLDLGNPFFTEMARGVEDVMSEREYAVILCGSASQGQREERNMRMLAAQQVRGVLVTPATDDRESLALLRERDIPTVMLDHAATRTDQCSVTVDDVTGGRLAVSHLLERGARNIAFVGGPLATRQNADRRTGALKALEAAGRGTLREVIVGEMTSRAGHKAAERLLAELPDAIFCANDLLAMGVLRVLLQQGISVPDRVMLIGYDDVEYTLGVGGPAVLHPPTHLPARPDRRRTPPRRVRPPRDPRPPADHVPARTGHQRVHKPMKIALSVGRPNDVPFPPQVFLT